MTFGPRVTYGGLLCSGQRWCPVCAIHVWAAYRGPRAFAWAWMRTVLGPVRTLDPEQMRNLVKTTLGRKP